VAHNSTAAIPYLLPSTLENSRNYNMEDWPAEIR